MVSMWVEDPGLFVAELRHLGGAAARPAADAGAVSAVADDYIVHGIAVPPVPEAGPAAFAAATGLVDALYPWAGPGLALTFLDGGANRTPGFGASIERLRALKAEWDPRNVFAAANPVPGAGCLRDAKGRGFSPRPARVAWPCGITCMG